jgi:hypothetical protein
MAENNTRLDRYFANVSTRRRSLADWRNYAAVTGSAIAMAMNASAEVIYLSQTVTAGPLANVAMSSGTEQRQNIALKNGVGGSIGKGFAEGVLQNWSSYGKQFG